MIGVHAAITAMNTSIHRNSGEYPAHSGESKITGYWLSPEEYIKLKSLPGKVKFWRFNAIFWFALYWIFFILTCIGAK